MAVEIVNGSYRPIYEQFDPMRLGENERSVAIARSYGQRIQTDNVKDDTIEELVNGYPSHGFVIDRDEAAQLFVNVRKPSPPELAMAKIFRSLSEQTLFADAPIIRCLEFGGNTHDKSEKEDEDNDQLDSEEDFPTCDEQTKSEQHADNTDEAGASVPPEEAGRSRD